MNYYIFEVNENNTEEEQEKYTKEIVSLEQYISLKLKEEGKEYLFYSTGYDSIYSYIKDKNKTVIICKDNNNKIIGVTYIIQGEGLYTQHDYNKYFKFNKEYIEYVKSKYNKNELYLIQYETFMKKIKGYKYAKELIKNELNITDLIEHCKSEKEKGTFDGTNKVREKVNRYIYNYFRDNNNDRIGFLELDRFYLLKFSDLLNCEDDKIRNKCKKETEENKILYKEYAKLLDLFDINGSFLPYDENKYKYLKPEEYNKYFNSNNFNTIKLDTYLIHPDYRNKGLAKIILFEGLKIQINKLIKLRPYLEEIYLCSTIHQDNYISKKVIKSLGKFDSIYVNRKIGINREIHFYKIEKKNLDEFINNNEKRIKNLKEKLKNDFNIILNDFN